MRFCVCGHRFSLHHKANFHPRDKKEEHGCVMMMSDGSAGTEANIFVILLFNL